MTYSYAFGTLHCRFVVMLVPTNAPPQLLLCIIIAHLSPGHNYKFSQEYANYFVMLAFKTVISFFNETSPLYQSSQPKN
jgi:hypothetical protein